MPKLVGVRERRHQPFYDTLFRHDYGTPVANVGRTTRLFASGTRLSDTAWTNMNMAGALPSDNTFIILSIRCWMFFMNVSLHGSNALTIYALMVHQLYLNLFVGDKPQFLSPAWYFPAGGGIDAADNQVPIANNGEPTQESILKLAKPIPVPARQHFYVEATFYDTGAISVLDDYINEADQGLQECKVMLDGIHTRDVQ